MIESYSFGVIKGFGKTLETDAIAVAKTKELLERKEFSPDYIGHRIKKAEIQLLVEKFEPEVFVIGTGAYGVAEIEKGVRDFLAEKRIKFFRAKTKEATKIFNEQMEKEKNVVALFHVTC